LFQQEFLSRQNVCGKLLIHIPLRRAIHATFVLKIVHENFPIRNLWNKLGRSQLIESLLLLLSLFSQNWILIVLLLRFFVNILLFLHGYWILLLGLIDNNIRLFNILLSLFFLCHILCFSWFLSLLLLLLSFTFLSYADSVRSLRSSSGLLFFYYFHLKNFKFKPI
jgi:hypothetical protein